MKSKDYTLSHFSTAEDNKYAAILLSFFALAGFWLRVRNLDALSMIFDEGIQGLAVQGILEHGLPIAKSGAIYLRSLPFSYSQAILAALFEPSPFWLRMASVIYGVGVIFPVYFLGKELFDKNVGLLAAGIIAFSTWEIEISRYARFYTLFQGAYILAMYYFFRAFLKDHKASRIIFFIVALLAFSSHAIASTICLLFIIPLIFQEGTIKRRLSMVGFAISGYAVWFLYKRFSAWLLKFETHSFEAVAAVPQVANPDIADPAAMSKLASLLIGIGIPPGPDISFFWQTVEHSSLFLICLLFLVGLMVPYLGFRFRLQTKGTELLLALAMIIAALFYQLALFFILWLAYLLLYVKKPSQLLNPLLLSVYGIAASLFTTWVYLMVHNGNFSAEQKVLTLAGFPNMIRYFFHRFIDGWPLMSVIAGGGLIYFIFKYISEQRAEQLFIIGAICLPIAFISFFTPHSESRYFFHLYPLIVIVFAFMMVKLSTFILRFWQLKRPQASSLGYVLSFIVILFISQDANPLQAWEIGSRGYLEKRDPIRSVTNLLPYAELHQDHESSAEFVQANYQPGDKILIIGSIYKLRVYSYYLPVVDYLVTRNRNFARRQAGKDVSLMTDTQLLRNVPDIEYALNTRPGRLWIIGDKWSLSQEKNHGFLGHGGLLFGKTWKIYPPATRDFLDALVEAPDFIGEDEHTFVKLIPAIKSSTVISKSDHE